MPDPFYVEIGDVSNVTVWGKVEELKQGYVVDDSKVFIPNFKI